MVPQETARHHSKEEFVGARKPFHSYLMGSTTAVDFSHLFSANAIIKQLLKTEILNNKNIDFKLNISANKIKNFDNFTNIRIYL